MEFIRIQRKLDESGWLDDIWAEGGAVLDCDDRVLLLFGGEDIKFDVPLRRTYLEMLRRVWSGWEIRWAFEGIAEIADYVGYPRARVLSEETNSDWSLASLLPPEEEDWTDIVGSVRTLDGRLLLFPLAGFVENYLLAGPSLELLAHQSQAIEQVPLDEWIPDGFPTGGFHIDSGEKRISYWATKDIPGIPRLISEKWSGWTVEWKRDEFESQLNFTEGRIRFPERSVEMLRDQVRKMLWHDAQHSPVETLLEFTGKEQEEGKNVQINPWALRDDRLKLDLKERQRIIAEVLGNDG